MTAILAAVTGLALWGVVGSAGRLPPGDLALAVAACALVPSVLRRPLPAGLALGVLAALSPVVTPAATFAAFSTARTRRFPVALAVAGVGIAGQAVQGAWRSTGDLAYQWWLLLMALAYAALLGWGALARSRAALVGSLRERARRAEDDQCRRIVQARLAERARIAREMHDVLAHRLSLVATYAGALEYRPDAPPERLAAAAGVVRAGVHQALEELREVISVLRADDADEERPQPVFADIAALAEESRAAGMVVSLADRVDAERVPAPLGRAAYRVVQEALTNARRHAAGAPVTVLLDGTPGGALTVDVRNPLPAAPEPPADPASPPSAAAVGGGTGLVGLAERVALAGGQLDHRAVPGGEFRLSAWLPWPA